MHFNCTNQVHTHIVQMALAELWKMLKPASSQMQIRFQRKYSLKRVLSAKYDWKWNIQVKQIRNTTWHKYEWKQINKSYCSHLLNKSNLRKWPPSEMRIGMKLENIAAANTISFCEQIQLVKMASSWNEDWEGDMFGLPAQQPWHFENFFLLIRVRETCMRSNYPNMSTL